MIPKNITLSDEEKQQLLQSKHLLMFDLYTYDIPVHDAVFYYKHSLAFLLTDPDCKDKHHHIKRLNQNPYMFNLKSYLHTNLYPQSEYLGQTLSRLVEQSIQHRIRELGLYPKQSMKDTRKHPPYIRPW